VIKHDAQHYEDPKREEASGCKNQSAHRSTVRAGRG
jgi:hypothetical protein